MTVMQRKTYFFEDLEPGMEASFQKVVTEASFAVLALAKKAGLWGNPLAEPPKPKTD
jgi:hypothetical protein